MNNIKIEKIGKNNILVLDENNYGIVSKKIIEQYGLNYEYKKIILDENFFINFYEEEFIIIKETALNILSYGDKAEEQIKNALLKKGFSEKNTLRVIEFLKNLNLINDKRYAERLAENNKGKKTKLEIKRLLYNKKFSSTIIENMMDTISETDELNIAEKYARKKYNTIKDKDENIKKYKVIQYLAYKGIKYDIAQKAYEKITEIKEWD